MERQEPDVKGYQAPVNANCLVFDSSRVVKNQGRRVEFTN